MFHMTLNFSLNIHSTKITKFLQFFQFIRSCFRFFYNKLTTINIYFLGFLLKSASKIFIACSYEPFNK